ncbi:plasmid maintenance system killer protein [Melaminivora suipulveris]|uniref:Plasmid maintenance system killer protein n=1 Tax=Melaminivora suipulveris TaxID=2109913 RepID=A0A2R3QGY9_9BURK|nr:plasmid maintenance system killer protein [Melaminivora suipulveris]
MRLAWAKVGSRISCAAPGSRLELLSGDRWSQHSVRINDQWLVCFVWTQEGAADVEIVVYH